MKKVFYECHNIRAHLYRGGDCFFRICGLYRLVKSNPPQCKNCRGRQTEPSGAALFLNKGTRFWLVFRRRCTSILLFLLAIWKGNILENVIMAMLYPWYCFREFFGKIVIQPLLIKATETAKEG